jgi:hypothetical protein
MFFFEKKNQKAFSPERSEGSILSSKVDKSLFASFSSEKEGLASS